jgi:dye decolorizing peroxidase
MLTRRQILVGSLATAGATSAVLATGGIAVAEAYKNGYAEAIRLNETALAKRKTIWSGVHQAGIESKPQAHTNFVAFDLLTGITADDMLRWMVLLTDDISRLTSGESALADPHPEIVIGPANLTVTVGFGPSMFKKLGLESKMPTGFGELPNFKVDQLDNDVSNGDVLIHIGADDLQILSHVTRIFIRDSSTFATMRYLQAGFTNAIGSSPEGKTQRNLMGQVDGTDNPDLNSDDFSNLVWIDKGPAWAVGGTQLVLRRIRMNLDTWDMLGREDKENVIGRHLDTGAPLGKQNEFDFLDFEAKKPNGLPVIAPFAHVRRASAADLGERFFRRPFNYQTLDASAKQLEAGLLWTAYCRDLAKQYVPVQKRLAEFDLLNQWTTPVGSAVFAIARGVQPGEIIAEELFS